MKQNGTGEVVIPNSTDSFVGSIAQNRDVVTSFTEGMTDSIALIDHNGTVTVLSDGTTDDFRPCISPDGLTIVFISRRDGNAEIYKMDRDGTNQTRLTNDAGEDYFPAISADGTKVVFTSNRTGDNEIYSMDIDGSNLQRLTNDVGDDSTPAWSPDGNTIVFASNRGAVPYEIYKMDADGNNVVNLTNTGTDAFHPSFNITGTRIFYGVTVGGVTHLGSMNPDGSDEIDLTPGALSDTSKTTGWVY